MHATSADVACTHATSWGRPGPASSRRACCLLSTQQAAVVMDCHAQTVRRAACRQRGRARERAFARIAGFGDRLVALEVVLRCPGDPPSDATNYLGGITDVLEAKTHRGTLDHLGDLAGVALYDNDRQVRELAFRHEDPRPARYTVRLRHPAVMGEHRLGRADTLATAAVIGLVAVSVIALGVLTVLGWTEPWCGIGSSWPGRAGPRGRRSMRPAAVMSPSAGTARRAAVGESTNSKRGTGSPRRAWSGPRGQFPWFAATNAPSATSATTVRCSQRSRRPVRAHHQM
ncbi:MAG: hypothetical protein JWO74_4582 [Solirubrobacterales bacterium]|nr:hypothetical protein [Solirubrobacterales bacterium]